MAIFVQGKNCLLLAAEIIFGNRSSSPANALLRGAYSITGVVQDVEVVGDHAYLTDDRFGVHILDVSDPANPVRRGGYASQWGALHLHASGPYVYVAMDEGGLQIFLRPPLLRLNISGDDTKACLQVVGPYGVNVQLQYSTNLSTWLNLGDPVTLGSGPLEILEHHAGHPPHCFYRAAID